MNHRRGLDRHQTLLLPERLEDYIAADNPVRFLDAFVGALDLGALGFAHAVVQNTGSPPYDPADLLRLYLYGYLHRVRSSRLLEAECQRNVEVLWLLGKLAPDHKTIADFRKDNLKALAAVARPFTVLCRKLELFGGQLAGIDGTKLAAVNSKDANFNEKKLNELIARADARLAEYLQQLDQADAAEPASAQPSRAELEEKIAALREKKDWHAELRAQLDADDKQISTTDGDARRMRGGGGGSVVGFNAQAAVDEKNKLIAAADVTHDETDVQQLASVARQAKENLGVEKLEVVADQGYYNNARVNVCAQHGIAPYIAKPETSANTQQGLFGKKPVPLRRDTGCLCVSGGPGTDTPLQHRGKRPASALLPGPRLPELRVEETMHEEQRQSDDHARRRRSADGSDGRARGGAPGENAIAQSAVRTPFWDAQALVWLHVFSGEGPGEGAVRMKSNDAGLQPQTRAQPGEP